MPPVTTDSNTLETNNLVRRFARNTRGRDLIIGDVHGWFSKLQAALDDVGFNPDAGDRLFSVGDLVDRGPESAAVMEWLQQPWFYAVAGNHEDMAIQWALGGLQAGLYNANGGSWNVRGTPEAVDAVAACFALLPVAIELQTADGIVGIVHADCPFDEWPTFMAALQDPAVSEMERLHVIAMAQWSRHRVGRDNDRGVDGVRAVVVGHTPMERVTSLGNVLYIDTGAWIEGRDRPFVLIDAATLRPARAALLETA